MKRIIALLLALLASTAALAAQPTEYQIELVVFSHLTPAGIQSEHWPAAIESTPQKAITLEPVSLEALASYPTQTCLPESAWNLTKDAKRIESRLHGQVLYHQAWRVSRSEMRKPIRFAINDQVASFDEPAIESPSKLSGTLSIKLTRYFNTNLQLTVTEPSNTIKPYLKKQSNPCWHGNQCIFSFDIKRRTRSKLLNYLDHPLYGALLEITPKV